MRLKILTNALENSEFVPIFGSKALDSKIERQEVKIWIFDEGLRYRVDRMTNSDRENSESDDEGQEFYVGGSEHSGQQVVGPGRKKPAKMIKNLFATARDHGEQYDVAEDRARRFFLEVFKLVHALLPVR